MRTCPQPLSPPQGLVRILSLSFLYPHHLLEFSVSIRTHSRTAYLKRRLDSTSSSSYQLTSLPLFMGNVFKRIVYTRRACFPTSLCIFIPICLLSPPLYCNYHVNVTRDFRLGEPNRPSPAIALPNLSVASYLVTHAFLHHSLRHGFLNSTLSWVSFCSPACSLVVSLLVPYSLISTRWSLPNLTACHATVISPTCWL